MGTGGLWRPSFWWCCLVLLLLVNNSVQSKKKDDDADEIIEDVNAKQLERILEERDYVAVFWYGRNCRQCDKVLAELETIDDDTSRFGVDFVKINDKKLSKQYGIKSFPALSYFRNKESILYEGDLMNEEQVLEFLTSLDAMDLPDQIEEVNAKILQKIVQETNYVAVLFYKPQDKRSDKILKQLETIDDDTTQLNIGFVKIADEKLADDYSLTDIPALVYYRNGIPIVYEDDLTKEADVLEWLVENKNTADDDDVIEDVTARTLETLITNVDHLAVLFYDNDDKKSEEVLEELEKIDTVLTEKAISFVKVDDAEAAKEYGVENIPQLLYFEKRIPSLYAGNLLNEEQVLAWLVEQLQSDMIEDINDEIMDKLIKKSKHLAVLFYNEGKESKKVLDILERIDTKLDEHKPPIPFVKINDANEAKEYGIERIPALVFFEGGIPSLYEGKLGEQEVYDWLTYQAVTDEIEEVTDEMLDMLIARSKHLAALFYDKNQDKSKHVLEELENVDGALDERGIVFVKISNLDEAQEYGVESLPALIYFENAVPSLYEGDLTNEDEVLNWLTHQQESDEILSVTDEMLDMLIGKMEFLAVLFYDKDNSEHQKTLNELENVDTRCSENSITFVRISNAEEAKEYGLDVLPALVYFENQIPSIYEGDLQDEETVLEWLLEQKSSDTIEQVSDELLDDIIEKNEYVVVYFSGPCKEGEKCDDILQILEGVDSHTDEYGIQFVTTEEVDLAKKYGVTHFPAIAFFRNQEPLIYKGDISDPAKVLAWVTDDNNLQLADQIEEVNTKMLKKKIATVSHVVAFFYDEKDSDAEVILKELESIDDECSDMNINFYKISDPGITTSFKLNKLPSIVYYLRKQPIYYTGDLMDEDAVLQWIVASKEQGSDLIEEVDEKALQRMLSDSKSVVVFFYEKNCGKSCEAILTQLESVDNTVSRHGVQMVKSVAVSVASKLDISGFPALVYFSEGHPVRYNGNQKDANAVLRWIMSQQSRSAGTGQQQCQMIGLEDSQHPGKFRKYQCCPHSDKKDSSKKKKKAMQGLAVLDEEDDEDDDIEFWDDEDEDDDDDDDDGDDDFADDSSASRITSSEEDQSEETDTQKNESKTPLNRPPRDSDPDDGDEIEFIEQNFTFYESDDMADEDHVLDWILEQHHGNTIANVTRQALFEMIEEQEYLGVVFYTPEEEESEKALRRLELIDEEMEEYGVTLVKIDDHLIAKKYGYRTLPGLTFFRRGKAMNFDGDILDEEEVLDWMTDPDNMELSDSIEKVNRRMFERILKRSDYLAVFFYSDDDCKQCKKVLEEIEHIDDEAANANIKFVKLDDNNFARSLGVYALPAIVFFRFGSKEPTIYAGDLKNEDKILEWLIVQKDPSADVIEEIEGEALLQHIRKTEFVSVLFYTNECENLDEILSGLENIDIFTDRQGISFVKTQDLNIAKNFGVTEYPALIYFENLVPSIYEGDLTAEEDVLHWIILQKTEDRIETVTRSMLESLLSEVQYLAVYFYKPNCKACDQALDHLEQIDHHLDLYGIQMVKIHDPQLAKRYGIKTFPAMVFFRNGNPLLYDGDLSNEDSCLEWLTDDDNRELADAIENVNARMLSRLLDDSPFLAVFFYDNDCAECSLALAELESIDEEADAFGIDFVKINDEEAAKRYGVLHTPALLYFRKKTPLTYEGDLLDTQRVLSWLTSQDVFEIKDEIEEINKKMLDKLLDENDFVAVYFYDNNCPKCSDVLYELEQIDSEVDSLDITFVKIRDPRYARKYGVNKFPALVYFRRRFPSIYRGDMMSRTDVLAWLQKNRFKHPELNVFMYALGAITTGFIFYTVFLLFCFKPPHQKVA